MAELATIARPYAEALFQSAKPAELATILEQLSELLSLPSSQRLPSYQTIQKYLRMI